MRRLTTRLLPLFAACDALDISPSTFGRRWQAVFTDPRPKIDRRPGVPRKVFEDELKVAVEEGAAAVLLFRRTMGREGR